MSIKHALVVDDSKSARLSLKKMLEVHHLVVELAESGEEALEFLQQRSVDVIFMDHTMPGMDGLEAVAAIKRNPQTAMIPVMMYTTKEGEVYVGQARALGAIGVLPKEVPPQALFDMLLKLGLVADKRDPEAPVPTKHPARRVDDGGTQQTVDVAPPRGIALEDLVARILLDQQSLRTELVNSQRVFTEQMASTIRKVQQQSLEAAESAAPVVQQPSRRPIWAPLFAGLAVFFAVLWWQARMESSLAVDIAARTATALSPAAAAQISDLKTALHAESTYAERDYLAAVDALQWAINLNASIPFEETAFDDARAVELSELLRRLEVLGFRGRVRVESHLGEFCLESDDSGGYQLAQPDLPIEACALLGHPLDDSSFVSERQSVGFAEFMTTSSLVNEGGVEVELVAHDAARSLRQHPFPPDAARAGDWNRIALQNNRLEYSLVIDRSATRQALRGD